MLHLPKTMPGPEADLQAEKLKPSGTYRLNSVLDQLKKDFYDKCYLCEDSPQSVNVEHFVPHRRDRELKFSWLNLFWACGHCNNIKGDEFDSILNCVIDDAVEGRLEYVFSPFPSEEVVINDLQNTAESEQTRRLLLGIFNGTTHMKKIESSGLRKRIAGQLLELNKLILDFEDSEGNAQFREYIGEQIKAKVHVSAKFVSFARAYLKRFPITLQKLRVEINSFPF